MLTVNQLILLASFVALIFVIRRWRMITLQKQKAATKPVASNPSPGSAATSGRSALNVREVAVELQALLAELEETSRRLTAQLDNRYTRLEQLLEEADGKIRRLETLAAQVTPPSPSLPSTSTSPLSARPLAAPVVSEAERMLQRLRQERGAPAPTDDPAYQPIYSLADRGKSSREIAQELGRQPGEIELILALRQPQSVR